MNSTQPLVSLIVLNWNGKDLLEECLRSVQKTTYSPIEILVVDNASTDGSCEMVPAKFPRVRLVRNERNLGYTGGNNVGFRVAQGKYVVTLNSDIAVEPSWLDDAVGHFERDETIGVVSCRQMNFFSRDIMDNIYTIPTAWLLPDRMGHGCRYDPTNPLHSRPGFVLGASGASAMYRKKMLDAIGGFEEIFFLFQEEVDLQMRAFLHGWKCLYVPTAVVYHMESATLKKQKSSFHYYHERNRIWFFYRTFPVSTIIAHLPVMLVREIRTAVNIIVLRRMPLVYLKARFDGFVGMFRFRGQRRRAVPLLRARDSEYRLLKKNRKIPLR